MRHRLAPLLLILSAWLANISLAAEPVELSEEAYSKLSSQKAIVLIHINWGRQWGCAGLDNAQLQSLAFTRIGAGDSEDASIAFKTPSALRAKDSQESHALLIDPGEYALSAFDVKIAKSVRNVGHLKGDASNLFKDGKPEGGTFSAGAGEIVYLGHFGLDCAKEAIPWRYYIEEKAEFDRYKQGFYETYPFTKGTDVQFRLFSTTQFGQPFSLE